MHIDAPAKKRWGSTTYESLTFNAGSVLNRASNVKTSGTKLPLKTIEEEKSSRTTDEFLWNDVSAARLNEYEIVKINNRGKR